MLELLTNFWFLLFSTITISVVVITIACTWTQLKQSSSDHQLKMQMLQRGMSAEDIERVLTCSSVPQPAQRLPGPVGIDGESLNEVVAALGEHEVSARTIEQVLISFRSVDEATQRLVSEAVQNLLASGDEIEDEQILAVVRPLCQPKDASAAVPFARSEAFHA